jgi:protease I
LFRRRKDGAMPSIADARILIMATDGFEESELFGPLVILKGRGGRRGVGVAKLDADTGDGPRRPGAYHRPDLTITEVKVQDFDALVLPGGVINPDVLRTNRFAVELVRGFAAARKPVAAICHGPWLLVEADVLKGRKATGWKSIRTDLRNAGAEVLEDRVVADGPFITAQAPEDLEAFIDALIAAVEA